MAGSTPAKGSLVVYGSLDATGFPQPDSRRVKPGDDACEWGRFEKCDDPGRPGELTERKGWYPRVDGNMTKTPPTPDDAEHAFWSWLGFWLQILVLGLLAIVGAFAASAADQPGDYTCGMALSLGAIALAFLRLKRRLDGNGSGWADFLLVGDMWNLALVIPLFALISLEIGRAS